MNAIENLESKIVSIAEKYADIVEHQLKNALSVPGIEHSMITDINDGIRMLNHVAATLERISRLHRGNDADD